MTPEQRDLIQGLMATRTRPALTTDEFLRRYPANDGRALALELAQQAHDEETLQQALIVGQRFDAIDTSWTPLLAQWIAAPWHHEHEFLVDTLSDLRDPDAVDALLHATAWVPDYLDWDDNRNLASKAIWGLGKNPSPRAVPALETLTASPEPLIATEARDRLLDRLEQSWADQLGTTHATEIGHASVPLATNAGRVDGTLTITPKLHGCALHLAVPDGRHWTADSVTPWHALQELRGQVEPDGVRILVHGCARTVHPSSRTRDTAYRLTLGQPWRPDDLVPLFAPAPAEDWASSAEQKQFHTQWLHSLTPWPESSTRT